MKRTFKTEASARLAAVYEEPACVPGVRSALLYCLFSATLASSQLDDTGRAFLHL